VSRAEPLAVPASPAIGGALRAAAVDFYFHSWRLVPANAIWGAALVGLLLLVTIAPFLALLFLPILAFPTVGLFRLAALIARGEAVAFSDALAAWRLYAGPTLLAGAGLSFVGLVFAVNIFGGLSAGSAIGWGLATFAIWGLLAMAAFASSLWPLLVDPLRADLSVRRRFRLAGLLVLAFPLRLGLLALVLLVILAISTVLFAALLTVSVAYCALVACHYVLPAADRFEGRASVPVPD
jgi:hypothetical protein